MNSLEAIFAAIESQEFSARVNVANNLKTFLRALGEEPAIRQLTDATATPEARAAVFERMRRLAATEAPSGYEHPDDAALAAYLWLLGGRDGPLAATAAATIAQRLGCWWARKVADQVLSGEGPPTAAGAHGQEGGKEDGLERTREQRRERYEASGAASARREAPHSA